MDFTIKMKEAMVLLHEACKMNDEWVKCRKCPFTDYCDAIEENGLGTPDDNDFLEF
jgi:hypothetical protein